MFAIIAAIVFAIGLFGGHIFRVNLLYLGLFFISLHLIFGYVLPFERWFRRGE